jgi:hypothetical protein
MRRPRVGPLVLGLLLLASPANAQQSRPQPLPATVPLRFESWQPASQNPESRRVVDTRFVAAEKNPTRQALIGGTIGAVAGFALCTTISTLADDSAEGGASFCPLDTTLVIVGGGFAVGAAIGWAI